MFTIGWVLVFGVGLGWWTDFLPTDLTILLAIPALGMAFTASQRKYMFWRAGAKCEADGCTRTWEDGYMLEAHRLNGAR